jgi:hypothetical protein
MSAAVLDKLDRFTGHIRSHLTRADAWLYYLVGRLPQGEQLAVARAMVRGDLPMAYEAARAAKKGKK